MALLLISNIAILDLSAAKLIFWANYVQLAPN